MDVVSKCGGRGVLYGVFEGGENFRIVFTDGEWREESPDFVWPTDTTQLEAEIVQEGEA